MNARPTFKLCRPPSDPTADSQVNRRSPLILAARLLGSARLGSHRPADELDFRRAFGPQVEWACAPPAPTTKPERKPSVELHKLRKFARCSRFKMPSIKLIRFDSIGCCNSSRFFEGFERAKLCASFGHSNARILINVIQPSARAEPSRAERSQMQANLNALANSSRATLV